MSRSKETTPRWLGTGNSIVPFANLYGNVDFFPTSVQKLPLGNKGSTINHLGGGRGAKRKKNRSERVAAKKTISFGGSLKKKISWRRASEFFLSISSTPRSLMVVPLTFLFTSDLLIIRMVIKMH